MAEMLIQSENLVDIADEVRELSGTASAMGLDAMKTNLGKANDEVDSQSELIAQIISSLNGKVGGSDGGTGGGIILPTLTNPGSASDLVQGKQLIGESGSIITGTMVDNGTVNTTLNTTTTSYIIPAGKHSGSGKVSVDVEDRTFTPTKSTQNFTPSSGKVIRNVTINSIPDDYIIPSGTKEINENGTYDVSSYASINVDVASTGGSSGFVTKSGTTTSRTISTGLSNIEQFFIYKESQTATGLIHLNYSKTGGTSYMYASAWSTNNYGTKTITNSTNAATVSGGSITLPSNTATSGGLSSGVTYKWVAVGTE